MLLVLSLLRTIITVINIFSLIRITFIINSLTLVVDMIITAIVIIIVISRSLLDCRALRPLQHPGMWRAPASSPLPEEEDLLRILAMVAEFHRGFRA